MDRERERERERTFNFNSFNLHSSRSKRSDLPDPLCLSAWTVKQAATNSFSVLYFRFYFKFFWTSFYLMEWTLCGFDPGTAPIAWQEDLCLKPFDHYVNQHKGGQSPKAFIFFTSHRINPMYTYYSHTYIYVYESGISIRQRDSTKDNSAYLIDEMNILGKHL